MYTVSLAVGRLLSEGGDPNMKDVDGDSALMQAAANGHIGNF